MHTGIAFVMLAYLTSWKAVNISMLEERPREEQIAYFESLGAAGTAAHANDANAALLKASANKIKRETATERHDRVLGDDFINAALQGETLHNGNKRTKHSNCSNPLPNGEPCWSNLWKKKDQYVQHLTTFETCQEARSVHVFEKISGTKYANELADGTPSGPAVWHFCAPGGRSVCRDVFLLCYPIGDSTLYGLQKRHDDKELYAHAKTAGTSARNSTPGSSKTDFGAISVIGWYRGYADVVGDWMPDEQQLIVPRRDRDEEHKEYEAAVGKEYAVSYNYFCQILRGAPELDHIKHARKVMNFQDCTKCQDGNKEVTTAIASHNKARITAAKRKRAAHHAEQRGERVCYYARMARGFDAGDDCISFILDKWDSDKTTVPFFARSPGHWWSATKHNVLIQHVLGILVHEPGGKEAFLYTFNESIAGSANSNIEGIRRMLFHKYSHKRMPRVMLVQVCATCTHTHIACALTVSLRGRICRATMRRTTKTGRLLPSLACSFTMVTHKRFTSRFYWLGIRTRTLISSSVSYLAT